MALTRQSERLELPQARTGGSGGRLYVLDGLRVIAALSVVLFHFTSIDEAWGQSAAHVFPTLHHFSQYGWIGVELFFLISGFVICMSTWGRSLGDFAISRVSRLYPAYWIGVLATAAVISLWPVYRNVDSFNQLLINLTMLQHGMGVSDIDGSYWTLFTELKFYLLFAIVVARGVTYRRCVLFCAIWTVVGIVSYTVDNPLLDMWAMPLYAPYFTAGIGFYLMYRFKPTAVLWGIVLLSLLLGQHSVAKRVEFNIPSPGHPVPVWPAQVLVLLCFVVMALVALGKLNGIRWGWLTTAGALTYPLYLLHENIGLTVITLLRGHVPALALAGGTLVLITLLSYVVHRTAERPLSKALRGSLRKGVEDIRAH
ncbi:acyltransferase [Streptomyces goshikiensis]|uniref:acyltransferase family protein n=1 Tax=Streptomyces goshikiensis TaxID=1942 RepID=UPI00332F76B5